MPADTQRPTACPAPIILRYDREADRAAFLNAFGNAFQCLPCATDEEALEQLGAHRQTPPALVMMPSPTPNLRQSSLLTAAKLAGCFRILISDRISLDDIIQWLDERVIDRCYPTPWDEHRLRADLFTATMAVDNPDWPAPTETNAQKTCVLIVDDETAATKYLSKQLLRLQTRFDVLCAASADEALDLLKHQGEQIAVIMTDQRMPGMKGVQLISELRQSYPYITRILTSAYGELDVALGAVNQGRIYGYEKKPWNAKHLLPVLDNAIDQHYRLKQLGAARRQETSDALQASLERRRARILESLSEPAPKAIAAAGVIDQFLSALAQIHTLSPGKAHLRALELPELEQALIRGLRVEVAELMEAAQTTVTFEGAELPAAMASALDTLLTASGLTRRSLTVERIEQRITITTDPEQRLRMYSHLLSPLTGVSTPLLEHQGALLALFVLADRLGGQLTVTGGQQSFDLRLILPAHAKSDAGASTRAL